MEDKKFLEKLNQLDWSKIATWTTVISISMVLFYSLGAYKHFIEIKKIKN